MPSDSDDDGVGDFDDDNENDQDIDEEITDAFQNMQDVDDAATEDGEEDSPSEDDDEEEEEDDDDEDEDDASSPPAPGDQMDVDMPSTQPTLVSESLSSSQADSSLPAPPYQANASQPPAYEQGSPIPIDKEPSPIPRKRSVSPALLRRKAIAYPYGLDYVPRTLTIEAVCALPHPAPTHALAASHCMSHLITGSDDGYIRDYDIFPAVNGKTFLSAPQRHHTGVVEGLLKSAQVRYWWENPTMPTQDPPTKEGSLSSVYSLAMHSDALWALAGSDTGHINLFTVRHGPGHVAHVFSEHKSEVSALCLDYDETSFFSAGWDGRAIQWDLHTGQAVRNFISHGAQLSSITVRPENAFHVSLVSTSSTTEVADDKKEMDDSKSDASYDPLFDDEPPPAAIAQDKAPPSNAPPLLDSTLYSQFSPNILMTTAADGQVMLWDKREASRVGRLWMHEKTPPLCLSACWSADGQQIYAGRRNSTIDIWDIRYAGQRTVQTLRNPLSSGVVSAVAALPDNKHLACASQDNIRLWDVSGDSGTDISMKSGNKSGLQFKIIPGHHGGTVSQLLIDPAGRFMVSASSSRGWVGESTRTVFVHDIKHAA